jgi:hypothetical protein
MGIVTNTSHRVDIPHERDESNGGPHWVEIRKISGSELDEAAQTRQLSVLQRMGSLIKDMQGVKAPDDTEEERLRKNTLEARRETWDPEVLIKYALVSWSYTDTIPDNPGAVLDAVTRDWLWETIVEENTRAPLPLPYGDLNLS